MEEASGVRCLEDVLWDVLALGMSVMGVVQEAETQRHLMDGESGQVL